MLTGAAGFVAIAWQAGLDQTLSDVMMRWFWPYLGWTVLGTALMHLEPLAHKAEWDAWKRHMENMSFGDMLLMRHIPHLP